MPARSTAYVPTLGDHWLQTEWSTIRHSRPAIHGTEQEATRSLYARVKFLTGRGWRVQTQKMLDDMMPGKRRMMVRVVPPAEYQHCGESLIEYKSCGGISFCPECRTEQARQEGINARLTERIDEIKAEETIALAGLNERLEDLKSEQDASLGSIRTQLAASMAADPERAWCVMNLKGGICVECGQDLRAHLPKLVRESNAAMYGE